MGIIVNPKKKEKKITCKEMRKGPIFVVANPPLLPTMKQI